MVFVWYYSQGYLFAKRSLKKLFIRHVNLFAKIMMFLNRSRWDHSRSIKFFLMAYLFEKLEHFLSFWFSQEKPSRGTFSPGTTAVGSTGSKKFNYFRWRTGFSHVFLPVNDEILFRLKVHYWLMITSFFICFAIQSCSSWVFSPSRAGNTRAADLGQ